MESKCSENRTEPNWTEPDRTEPNWTGAAVNTYLSRPAGFPCLMKTTQLSSSLPYIQEVTSHFPSCCCWSNTCLIPSKRKSIMGSLCWKKVWLFPYKFCIYNKIKEIQIQIIQTIYPTNVYVSKLSDIKDKCSLQFLFYGTGNLISFILSLWTLLEHYI